MRVNAAKTVQHYWCTSISINNGSPKPMKEQIVKLVERFPDRKDIIESLAGSNTRFRSLLQDHHDVHRKLARDEVSGDPATKADLEARFRNLEEEMIRLIQGYPIA